MRTPTPSNHAARCAIALLHKLRRGLRAYVVVGDAISEQERERLYRDVIGYTFATHQRLSTGRPATNRFALPGAAANARSTNADVPAGAEDAQTAEPGSRPNDGPEPPTSGSNHAVGASAPDHARVADVRLILYGRQRPVDPTREPWVLPGPAASAHDGELIPRLHWLLAEAAGTIANIAHELETRAAEVDDDTREQLHDDILVLDDELATVNALLGNEVDWDAEMRRLLAGEIPPAEIDAEDEDDE
jgi:hypothetical protein